jgi:hypothetical protein
MKKMKIALFTSVALAACMSTSVFAQKSKDSPITLALSLDGQASVSTSASVANAGNWSSQPLYYKTTGITKMTQANIIADIGHVLGIGFTSKAQLELVQGELSGFFNVIPGLSNSAPLYNEPGYLDGVYDTTTDTGDSTIISADTVTYVALANGRHFQPNPITGLNPVGHFQPWGQIFVKDPGAAGYSAANPLCVNVTYFFDLEVQECYDCYFLNSFISDATFSTKTTVQGGPPCCGVSSTLVGKGKDQYYLTLSFDDTIDNPYLNPSAAYTDYYVGKQGVLPTVAYVDGSTPDALTYSDPIKSGLGTQSPYEAKFTLNGILAYSWTLGYVNAGDLLPDFYGTATYTANGYGFVALVCRLITATGTISEKLVVSDTCCLDIPWYDSWYGVGFTGDPGVSTDYTALVFEDGAPGVTPAGTYKTTQENTVLNLTRHVPDWTGTVVQYPEY